MAEAARLRLAQTGVILFVDRYEACVAFYRDTLDLPVILVLDTLIIFAMGDGYLEVEQGGAASDGSVKPRASNPVVLRFDVDDLDQAARLLRAKGVDVEQRTFDWGMIAVFADPDGNKCELKRHDPRQTVLQGAAHHG